jgi:hypothetical protein
MTIEELIRMAREVGAIHIHGKPNEFAIVGNDSIKAFAALVAAAERNRTWTQEHWTEYEHSIAAAEREACAKEAESWDGHLVAAEIRARGQA